MTSTQTSEALKVEITPETNKQTISSVIAQNTNNETNPLVHNGLDEPKYFNGVEISKLTKRQMKKYNKMLKWEARKKEKRANERLKVKKRKMEAKMNNMDLGPSRKQLKRSTMANSSCKTVIVVDLSFDHLMISKVKLFCYLIMFSYLFAFRIWGKW